MGQLLGVADNCTDELAFIILPLSGNLIIRKSVWGIPPETLSTDAGKADILELDGAIACRFGDATLKKRPREDFQDPPTDFFNDEKETDMPNPLDVQDADVYTPEAMDKYLSATLLLPHRVTS